MAIVTKWTKRKDFYAGYRSMRDVRVEFQISFQEYQKRGQLVVKLENQGVSLEKINSFWDTYRLRDGDINNTILFETFINNQRLIQEAQLRAEQELLERLKEAEKLKEISDLNLFPPKTGDTSLITNTSTSTPIIDKKDTNFLFYGGIGLVVLIGAFLIFKKK